LILARIHALADVGAVHLAEKLHSVSS
jgi:hypothetical protein